MLRIRLRRVGKKGKPSYRIVVADSRAPRDGAYLEWIGNYDPMADPPTITLKEDRAGHWLSKGAQPSDAVARILDKSGLYQRTEEFRTGARKSGENVPAPVAAAAPTVTTTPTQAAVEVAPEEAPPEATVDEAPAEETVDEAPAEEEAAEAPVDEAPAEDEATGDSPGEETAEEAATENSADEETVEETPADSAEEEPDEASTDEASTDEASKE